MVALCCALPALCACWRCHILIGSAGEICEKINVERERIINFEES